MRATTRLREELAKGLVVAPGCYDAFSARLAELAGFSAVHMTGLGVEASLLGAPDLGLLSMREVVDHAARLAQAVTIPVLADIDTGFGGVLNINRTIREMERAGVAGIHLEDQAMPKRCPLLAGREVIGKAQAIDRVKAALDARTDPDFVIVARTDADVNSFEEVIERCNLFLEAGADMVMPMIMQIERKSYFELPPNEQMAWSRKLIAAVDGPVMNMGNGPPPGYTTSDLAEVGYAFTMFASGALGVAANAIAGLFEAIRRDGTDALFTAANAGPYNDPLMLMRAARLDDFAAVEKAFTTDG